MPRLIALVCLALVALHCSSGAAGLVPPALSPPETFDWSGQAIRFSPPPTGWRREGGTSPGTKGAGFIKTGSVGEGIGLGDYYLLADRHRSAHLREMIAKFETYDDGFAGRGASRRLCVHRLAVLVPRSRDRRPHQHGGR